jgi:acyl carrier protein
LKGIAPMLEIKNKVRDFIVENFLFGDAEGLGDDTSFLDEGIIDSTGVLELVSFIEKAFSIQVEDDEMVPQNLDSLNCAAVYIQSKASPAAISA